MQRDVLDGAIGLLVLAAAAWFLYRPKVQQSDRYQALVVPLANIMDVGFLVLSPIIVVLVGYAAPLFMLGICLVAIAAGFVIAYNIRHYEPLVGSPDPLHRVAAVANWSLFAASMANIAYYTMLLMTLVLLPLELYSEDRVTTTSVIVLIVVIVVGYSGRLPILNRLGDRTTAFNLAALFAVLAAFAVYNIQEAIGGNWGFPTYEPTVDSTTLRQIVGLFAMVQGFEASRYIGARFSGEVRVSTMRWAQVIATSVFVLLIALVLLPFGQFRPDADATAIFVVSKEVSPYLPWLILAVAVGSQLSAITNATTSRSALLDRGHAPNRRAQVHVPDSARAHDHDRGVHRGHRCRRDRVADLCALLRGPGGDRRDARLSGQGVAVRGRIRRGGGRHVRHRRLRTADLTRAPARTNSDAVMGHVSTR